MVSPNDFSELLRSGRFADATVYCGGKTWNVHKAILSHRSDWFGAALRGNYAESESGIIRIQGEDPATVDFVIQYLYAGNLSFIQSIHEDVAKAYEICTAIYKFGDYIGLQSLMDEASAAIVKHNRQQAAKFQRAFSLFKATGVGYPTLDAKFKETFFIYAKIVFQDSIFTALQEIFVQFIRYTGYIVLYDGKVHTSLRDIPEFAQLILADLFTGGAGCIPRSLPSSCEVCNKDVLNTVGDQFYISTRWNSNYETVTGVCDRCFREANDYEDLLIIDLTRTD